MIEIATRGFLPGCFIGEVGEASAFIAFIAFMAFMAFGGATAFAAFIAFIVSEGALRHDPRGPRGELCRTDIARARFAMLALSPNKGQTLNRNVAAK